MNTSWSNRLLRMGTFLLLFGAYLLFLKAPATNAKQHAFRVAVPSVGGAMVLVGAVLKVAIDPSDDER